MGVRHLNRQQNTMIGPIKLGQRVVVKEPQTALSLAASEKENEVVIE